MILMRFKPRKLKCIFIVEFDIVLQPPGESVSQDLYLLIIRQQV